MADVITLLPAGTGTGATGVTHDTGDVKDQFTFEVVAGAGISASAITFQGSNDGSTWNALPLNSIAAVTGALAAQTQPVAPAAPGNFFYAMIPGSGVWRYIRAITGTVTGGTVSAFAGYGKT